MTPETRVTAAHAVGAADAEFSPTSGVSGVNCTVDLPPNRLARVGASNGKWRGGRHVDRRGYVWILAPGHAKAGRRGYVFEHTLVAEQALGGHLPAGAVVHHVNGNPADNRNCNLVVCQDQAYHFLLHRRQRALSACGHADWLRCYGCGKYGPPAQLKRGYHRSCRTQYERRLRAKNRQPAADSRTQSDSHGRRGAQDPVSSRGVAGRVTISDTVAGSQLPVASAYAGSFGRRTGVDASVSKSERIADVLRRHVQRTLPIAFPTRRCNGAPGLDVAHGVREDGTDVH